MTLEHVSFGRRVKEYREHREWSLADLVRATHYSRSYLSNVENGRKASNEELARVCDEALRAKGELIAAAKADAVGRLDETPWQTAELVQRLQASDATPQTLESLRATVGSCAASTTGGTRSSCGKRLMRGCSMWALFCVGPLG